jgi:hypothetical protein
MSDIGQQLADDEHSPAVGKELRSPISALVNDPDRISERICCKGGEQRVSRFAVRDSVFPNG